MVRIKHYLVVTWPFNPNQLSVRLELQVVHLSHTSCQKLGVTIWVVPNELARLANKTGRGRWFQALTHFGTRKNGLKRVGPKRGAGWPICLFFKKIIVFFLFFNYFGRLARFGLSARQNRLPASPPLKQNGLCFLADFCLAGRAYPVHAKPTSFNTPTRSYALELLCSGLPPCV